ncbi:hypothetical protein [Rhodococcus qingshengii]|uniref:hypothetical protein n=1 Tax=Rhodococcus qingshengii TaxID=334542 RepID=UPI0036DE285B
MASRSYDEVVLHTFFSNDFVVREVKKIRNTAEQMGRDPQSVELWSRCGGRRDRRKHVPEGKTVGRIATYLQVYRGLLVATNR